MKNKNKTIIKFMRISFHTKKKKNERKRRVCRTKIWYKIKKIIKTSSVPELNSKRIS